jgi:hypothetical protein
MLTIKTKVTSEVEKTIPLPYYCRENSAYNPWYFKVIDENMVIKTASTDTSAWVTRLELTESVKYDIANAIECTYYEFQIELNKAIDTIKETALSEGALKEAI